MKIEDLTQDKLDELLASQEAMQESVKGLKADLAKAKAKAKGAEIDPETHAALQTQVEELTDKLNKTEGMGKKEIEKLTKSLQEKDAALQKYLIDAQLSDVLAKSGVKPEFMDASKALLKLNATIKAENGEYMPIIGDKPLTEYVGDWVKSDQGKHFISAPDNNGGGAQGGSDGGGGKTMTRAQWDAADHGTRAAFAKDGGKVTD